MGTKVGGSSSAADGGVTLLWFLCGRVVFGAERPVFPFRHFASFNLAVHRLIGISAPILMPAHTRVLRC